MRFDSLEYTSVVLSKATLSPLSPASSLSVRELELAADDANLSWQLFSPSSVYPNLLALVPFANF